jgi:DNA modification methylase
MIKMNLNTIYTGDALEVLQTLPDNSIDCVITSPPYYGLRDYGTATWYGGNLNCKHIIKCDSYAPGIKQRTNCGSIRTAKDICPTCGAVRVDNQIGMEDTPEAYKERLVSVFMGVHRVLKPAGTLWLNIGDSYNGSGGAGGDYGKGGIKEGQPKYPGRKIRGLKPKDLTGIPWMIAFALRDAGWYLRQDIIWHKPNPMPESIRDRCTKSHEYIFLLSKSNSYYFDHKAIMEPAKYAGDNRGARGDARRGTGMNSVSGRTGEFRNKRSVWVVNTKPYKGAHFATYPEALIVDCVKAGCPAGGVVLDPFFGAGTTGVVAQNLGRNYIGIDLNAKYVEIANKRIRGV